MIDASKLERYQPIKQYVTNTAAETKALGKSFSPLVSIFNRARFSNKPVIKIGLVGQPDTGKTHLVEGLLEKREKSNDPAHKRYEDRVDYDVQKEDGSTKTVTAEFYYSVNHGWLLQYDAGLDEETLLELEMVDGFLPYEMDYLNSTLKGQSGVIVFEHAGSEKQNRQGFDLVFNCYTNSEAKTRNEPHSLTVDVYMSEDLQHRFEQDSLEL